MAISQTARHCRDCGLITLHQRNRFGIGWGLFWSVLTGGLFIPVWLLIALAEANRDYRCVSCHWPAEVDRALENQPGMAAYPPPDAITRPLAAVARPVTPRRPRCRRKPPAGRLACPACDAILPADARFCRDCGTPLAVTA